MDENEKLEIESGDENVYLDVRQLKCWKAYIDPKSDTYGNARRSALKAGYTESYAITITNAPWYKMKKRRMNLLGKAERVLDRTLTIDPTDRDGNIQADLLRVQTDVAKHITKTLGKDEGYSERSEVTGKDGNPIIFMPAELFDKYNLETTKEAILVEEDNNK